MQLAQFKSQRTLSNAHLLRIALSRHSDFNLSMRPPRLVKTCGLTLVFFLVIICFSSSTFASKNLASKRDDTSQFTDSKGDRNHAEKARLLYKEAIDMLPFLRPYDRIKSLRRKISLDDYASKSKLGRLIRKLLSQTSFLESKRPDQYEDLRPVTIEKSEQVSLLESKLRQAADHGSDDALFTLANMAFYGHYAPRNYTLAFNSFKELADRSGNATAQQILGFMYATGLGNVVERDQGLALVYHTFAAFGGDTAAEMTLGYRYLMGIGTPINCEDALFFYKRVARKAIEYYESGPPLGRTLPDPPIKLSDDHGGVYGHGHGDQSSQGNSVTNVDDVLEYYKLFADKGQIRMQLLLGQTYYTGKRDVPRNYEEALKYFHIVVKQYWPNANALSNEAHTPSDRTEIASLAGTAAGYLGRMYLRGEGTPVDSKIALFWFQCGSSVGDPLSQNAIGIMYLQGIEVQKHEQLAMQQFKLAAEQDYHEGQVNLGKLYLKNGETGRALGCFEAAAQKGNFAALYYIAEMYDRGIGRPERSCQTAAVFYKNVAERGNWLHNPFPDAYNQYKHGDRESALVNYLMAAERGYDAGQGNVAWMLDPDKSYVHIGSYDSKARDGQDFAELALVYWTRAANLRYSDALLKMGDYYLKGIGIEPKAAKAAGCYQAALDEQSSAMAAWNLGWMHENGIGVTQDFHLAKRYYDQALQITLDAYVPVKLALIKLYIRSFWNTITGGSVNSIASPQMTDTWDLKRFFREIYKKWINDDSQGINGFSDITINEELEGLDRSNEDENSPMANGQEIYGDEDDDGFETLMILGLCLAIGYLVYIRQFRYRQQQQQRQQQQNSQNIPRQQEDQRPGDAGVWPQDPAEQARWLAGGPM